MPSKSKVQKYVDSASIGELGLIKNIGKIKSRIKNATRRFDTDACEKAIIEKSKVIPHQYEFLTSWDTRYVGLSGGYGSGKTYINVCKSILFTFRSQGCDHLFFEPSIPLLDDIAIPQFDTIFEEFGIPVTFKRTPRPIYVLHLPGGNTRILLRSLENYERIIGINAASCTMDEIDTVRAAVVQKAVVNIQGRARVGTCLQQFAFGSTPEGYNFLYSFFMLGAERTEADIQVKNNAEYILGKDRKLVFGDSEKNPFVRKDYIDDLYSQYPPNIAKAYIKGKFVNLATVTVFSEYKRENHSSTFIEAELMDTVLTGADFNVGNMRFVLAVIRPLSTGKKLIVYREGKSRDTYDYIAQLGKKYEKHIAAGRVICFPDSTGTREYTSSSESDHEIIRSAGIRIMADKKNPPVPSVVAHVNNCFYQDLIEINPIQCPDLVKCCEQWGYGKDLKPEKGGAVDHSNIGDAFKYLVWGSLPKASRGIASGGRIR
jgi:phage terminase large subunit